MHAAAAVCCTVGKIVAHVSALALHCSCARLIMSAALPPRVRQPNQGSSSASGPRPGANPAREEQFAKLRAALEAARVAAEAASANMAVVLAQQERMEAVTKENVARLQSILGGLELKSWGCAICCTILVTIAMATAIARRRVQ